MIYNRGEFESIEFDFIGTLNTDGRGYWNRVATNVDVYKCQILFDRAEPNFGELRVYFNPESWNISEYGLIYTDKKFLYELRNKLSELGFIGSDVDYSEQGMQDKEYVSCDIGAQFINDIFLKEWCKSGLAGI